MPLDFSNITSANSTLQILNFINLDWTSGLFGVLLIAVLGIVLMANLRFYGTKDNFLFTAFFLSIISGLAWLAGIVGIYVFIVCVVLGFIGVFLAILLEG